MNQIVKYNPYVPPFFSKTEPPVNRNEQSRNQHLTEQFDLPEILFISSYPPRECGIATFTQDLIQALDDKFKNSFSIRVCALESGAPSNIYPDEVKYVLDPDDTAKVNRMAQLINANNETKLVVVQHEFGFFHGAAEESFSKFIDAITKPVIIAFHTVLPRPNDSLKAHVQHLARSCESILVMTQNSAHILQRDYDIPKKQINVIEHGTHLVLHLDKDVLKEKYNLKGRKVLSTFGLLSSGKSIETTLEALPSIIQEHPDVTFLIIGKTHPGVLKSEAERYRNFLESKVKELNLHDHVRFINRYLPLTDLLEYLQLTDIYLFTSKDPNQAVSGTFAYAMSCACPIISTPIPHAQELLRGDTGIIIDFQNPEQLAASIHRLLRDESLLAAFTANTLQRIAPTTWENSAIAHARLFEQLTGNELSLKYRVPAINLAHLKKMTTDFGIIQFAKFNLPDINSGFTLDDNSRALIALCMHYELTGDEGDLPYLNIYLDFIRHCQQPEGYFLNYADDHKKFTAQNQGSNLADSNGRAIWALGYLISRSGVLPSSMIDHAEQILKASLRRVESTHSTRAMAFALKGIYFYNQYRKTPENLMLIRTLANRLMQMYRHEAEDKWKWFESYMTYANSVIPEALLYAWMETGDQDYKDIAKSSFDFLISQTFDSQGIKVISNKSWLHKGKAASNFGEQPIDVAYTILALNLFYQVFNDENYLRKMESAFNWFLGNNHLHQIIYNPCTGGSYDGLEETHVNLNQGAESTISYLLARLTIEKHVQSSFQFVFHQQKNLA